MLGQGLQRLGMCFRSLGTGLKPVEAQYGLGKILGYHLTGFLGDDVGIRINIWIESPGMGAGFGRIFCAWDGVWIGPLGCDWLGILCSIWVGSPGDKAVGVMGS